jgi:two-component system nitrate/nitrite response regulator NarL
MGATMRRRRLATVLVGPGALSREGLTRILSAADFRVMASASSIEGLLLDLPQDQSILLVIDMGDDPYGVIDQIKLFKKRYPNGRIAVLANRYLPSRDMIVAFGAGANAYFVKVTTCATFIKSLELIALGETILPPAILPFLADPETHTGGHDVVKASEPRVEAEHPHTPQLSARERTILRCLVDGNSNKAIARRFDIAEATVKVHVKCILRKIRVNNRTQAAIWAMNNNSSIVEMERGGTAKAAGQQTPVVRAVREIRALEALTPKTDSAPHDNSTHTELPAIEHLVRIGVGRSNH